ncbi:magnesium transporter [Longimicrobium sp.]|uniref:magnesium transporter n=1 Tax=Longimicrobium sp. TaxID=2029185 RepID=UPI002B5C0802|nr:magnesium transporter [Longimicrobium sp.]HSU12800.1 magnesium transporter [Longimicrobium sp.]
MADAQDERAALEPIRALLERGDEARAHELLTALHPSDLADLLEGLDDDERMRVLVSLADRPALAAEALAEMEPDEHPEDSLAALGSEQMADIIAELADDDAADIIGDMDPDDQVRALAALPRAEAGEIRELMGYDEESAGGIMTTELVAVPNSLTAAQTIDEVRRQAQEVSEIYVVFVVDRTGLLEGYLPLQTLVTAPPDAPVDELVLPPVATVLPDIDQGEVARILSRYNLSVVPVVDERGRLLGGVTFDDVIDVVEAEATRDILALGGTSEDEELRGGWWGAVRTRFPWLLLNLGTAFLAAAVYTPFRNTLEKLPLIAAWTTIVAGMGGNGASQALAVTVRRLALQGAAAGGRRGIVSKELLVGLANGLGNGIVAGTIAALFATYWMHAGPMLGVVVMAAMWGNLVIAGVAGGLVPLVLERMGVDPAISSSVVVTTFTDMGGFFLTLYLATVMLL